MPALLGTWMAACNAAPLPLTCAQYNLQSTVSADRLNGELRIANGVLRQADLDRGHNPKLDAYMAQFSERVQVHGLQGRPEPASLTDVRAHYANVMSFPREAPAPTEEALREDLKIVAGPMAAHRYRAALRVAAFPPDFGYYDIHQPLNIRGQTIFDFGGADGTILERWSNHDNKYRTGQIWRFMLANPRQGSNAMHYRQDLKAGDEAPGARIDQDGDRLNRVFNGELAYSAQDFRLQDGRFVYGPAQQPADPSRAVTEARGFAFIQQWLTHMRAAGNDAAHARWLAPNATLYGAGCDQAKLHKQAAITGGAEQPADEAGKHLSGLIRERLGSRFEVDLLQPVEADTPYAQLPVSGWSHVGFQTQLTGHAPDIPEADEAEVRYCAQWIMALRADPSPEQATRAETVWLNLEQISPTESCADHFERERVASEQRYCRNHPAWCRN